MNTEVPSSHSYRLTKERIYSQRSNFESIEKRKKKFQDLTKSTITAIDVRNIVYSWVFVECLLRLSQFQSH